MEKEKLYSFTDKVVESILHKKAIKQVYELQKVITEIWEDGKQNTEVIQIDYPQILFTVQWMCKINAESFAPASLKEMKELADECHVAYLKET